MSIVFYHCVYLCIHMYSQCYWLCYRKSNNVKKIAIDLYMSTVHQHNSVITMFCITCIVICLSVCLSVTSITQKLVWYGMDSIVEFGLKFL